VAYRSSSIRDVYVVVWERPEQGDVARVMFDVRALRERNKDPVTYVAIVPVDGEPPEGEARGAMISSMRELIELSETVHLVFEGEGFRQSIKRSVLAGILLASGKRGRVLVHATVDEALAAIHAGRRDAVRALTRQLGTRVATT
jgi:hypothetical protein